jgi:nucleotide-binding universal stress UspA family protein
MTGLEHCTGPRIVAGVDGSPSSMSALRWAIRQAGLTGATVDAMIAVPVRARVVQGDPAQVLLDACDGADLLVVGSRGHAGFTEALLGSVSQHCVHHAHCPVVVIRGQEHD